MDATITTKRVRQDILRLCHAGLDSWRLRIEVFDRLQRVIPGPMYWCSTTDPETLLFTGAVMQGIEHAAIPGFISNELRGEDANQFTELAKRKFPVGTLYAAMRGDLRRSPRFHELLEPAGQGDEMRAALRAGKSVWGSCACIGNCATRRSPQRRSRSLPRLRRIWARACASRPCSMLLIGMV